MYVSARVRSDSSIDGLVSVPTVMACSLHVGSASLLLLLRVSMSVLTTTIAAVAAYRESYRVTSSRRSKRISPKAETATGTTMVCVRMVSCRAVCLFVAGSLS